MSNLVCLGELLIDFFPAEIGKSVAEVSSFRPVPGGAPANVAVAATRLGFPSAFIGKVGEDAFGRLLEEVLKKEGVETGGMRFDPLVRTTLNFLTQPDVNSYDCLFYRNPGADTCLRPEELDAALLSQCKVFHFGSLSLTDEPARSATREAIRLARSGGALISYDVNFRPTLWKDPQTARDVAMDFLAQADILKVNEGELKLLTGGEDLANARSLIDDGPDLCLVTLGPQGCYFQTRTDQELVPAYLVDTVDATGCGDAFIAGFLTRAIEKGNWSEVLDHTTLQSSIKYANAVGALTALTQGVIPALPTAGQVSGFLEKVNRQNI